MFERQEGVTRIYVDEQQRLLEVAKTLEPHSDQYTKVMARIDQLDKIIKRSSERTRALIPAVATIGSVVGIYALQQFAGVIVPKALDMLTGKNSKNREDD